MALTVALGASTMGGVLVGLGATAGAVTGALGSGSTAASTADPTLTANGAAQPTGAVVLTLASGTSVNTGDAIGLTVSAAGGGTVQWAGTPSVTVGSTGPVQSATATVGGTGSTVVSVALTPTSGGSPSSVSQQITVSGLEVSAGTGVASGDTPASGAILAAVTYVPSGAASGTAFGGSPVTVGTVPAASASFGLTAVSAPTIGQGQTNQPAGNWTLAIGGSSGGTWTSGDLVAITVAPNGALSAPCSGTSYTAFGSTVPTVAVTASSGVSNAPAVTAAEAYGSTCNQLEPNVLEVQFTNSGSVTSSSGATITISNVSYSTGSTSATGPIAVSATYENSGGTTLGSVTTSSTTPDAVVFPVVVTANSPAVDVAPSSLDAAVSPIALTEASAGGVPQGWVCVTLTATGSSTFSTTGTTTNAFDPASTPKVSVTSGPGTVASTATLQTVGTSGTTDNTVAFDVTTPQPVSGPSTYQLGNLAVDTGSTPGTVGALVTTGVSSASACPSTAGTATVTAYSVAAGNTRIYGANADATAATELETTFPYGSNVCPGYGGGSFTGSLVASRPVVLATDSNYPDALAGAYLARDLGTGELLTPPGGLSTATIQAMRLEGITSAYIVGGPYVVSNAVVTQLQNIQVYSCGGQTGITTLLGTAQDLSVTRIYGQTEYGTAADIAQFPGGANVGSLQVPAAYAGTNSSGGNGTYNDTSGAASASAGSSTAMPTAILATGQGFQDAEAASVLSYTDSLPVLLTTPRSLSPQASSELQALGVKQVIVMGGPIAISNAVVSSVQSLGMSVLRIAGQDFTDTAVQLAKFEMNTTTGGLGLGWQPAGALYVARGDFYTDGLAGAVDAATGSVPGSSNCVNVNPGPSTGTTRTTCSYAQSTPLLLTENPSTVGEYLTAFLNQAGSSTGVDSLGSTNQIKTLNVLGGPLAVQPATVTAMNAALAAG